ncbi:unnamed protein product [Schistosoma turkestanicum]|nr:unnamed protein product [Schistosoma turkestanicum]
MSDFSSKFAQLSVRSEKSSHNDLSNIQRANGDEDKGSKGNPWKPIVPSSENNSLEADAWPEPSAPTEQRRIARIAEEKPKRKLKWHSYEVDDTTCGFPRGRGRSTVGPFAGANYTSNNVRSFRRGYGGYRSRILPDTNRGRNSNGFYRHPGRLASIRPVNEPKENTNESTQKNSPVQTSDTSGDPVDAHLSTEVSSHDEKVSDRSLHPSESVELSSQQTETELQNKPSSVSVPGPIPRKAYRERSNVSSQSGSQSTNIPSNYDAGPIGRARRSYQRQHQPMFPNETDNHSLNSHPTLVANSSIQPLIPFQTVPQIAYIIPGAPATMLAPALQLTQTPASHAIIPAVSLANTQILPTQPTIQHPIAALPHLPVDSLPIPILPDVSAVQSIHPSFNPQSSMTSTSTEQPTDTSEVVDVTQVIAYINEVGWKKVVFPTSLREHRAVAAAIKDALGSSNHDLADLTETAVNKNDLSNSSSTQSRSDDAPARPIKADDVIIVEDRVFFVPRNANRTKFLKFRSKLDYIKHHVEYYFSESNLLRDSHLYTILTANQDVCPISELLQFNRLRWVSTTESELLDAVSSSNVLLVVFSDGSPAGITRVCPTLVKHLNEGCSPSVEFGYVRPVNQGVSLTTSTSDQNAIVVQVSTASSQSLTHPNVDPLNQNISILNPVSAHSFGSQVPANSTNAPFPVTSQVLGVSGQSMSSIPHNSLPNYIQSSAHILTPNNFGILTNTSPGNIIYSSSSPSQQHSTVTAPFYQSDLGPQSTIRPAQAFHCPQIYTQHQAAAFMAAAANQCSLLASGPNTPVLPPSDPNTASFISALYRLATPGSPAPIVGTYVPSVGNPNNMSAAAAPNSAVFLQFIPGAHPGQTNAYFTPSISCPPGTNSLLSRSVPAHASGMWIPLNQGSGANGGIVSTHPYQPYVALTQAHPNLSLPNNPSGNGGLYAVTSSHSFPTAFGTVPLTIGPDVSGFGVQKVFSHAHSLSSPHTYTNHQSPVTSNPNVTAINTPTGHASQISVNHSSVPGSQPSNSNLALGKRMPTNNTQT